MADTKQKTTGAKPSKRVLEKKQKRSQKGGNGDQPTKEEYAVAKFVRFKCPTKKTVFGGSGGDEVHYFVGSKAVDVLMESKWSSKKKKQTSPLFTDRQSCVDYMQQLLMKGLFFRAKKLVPKLKEKPSPDVGEKKTDKKKKGADAKEDIQKSPKVEKESELKRRGKEKAQKEDEKSAVAKEEKDDEDYDKAKEKSSKSRKVRLDFHSEQLFIDAPSVYVWKYDPTSVTSILIGLGIVIGAIGLCLFPLWPLQLRAGVYYLSLGAMGFLGAFIGLVVLRHVIFGVVWATTAGRHHFWLLPNLTEDCSILESFKPTYSHKYYPPGTKPVAEKKKKKEKKSDSEDEGSVAKKTDESEDDEARDIKEAQTDDQASGSGSENEDEQEKDAGSATVSQDEDENEKSYGSSNTSSARSSVDEEIRVTEKTTPKKKRASRRVDHQESNNGDFEIIESPAK